MSTGPISNLWHAQFPPPAQPRRVEPTQPPCPPRQCDRDLFEPLPFDKFLARQNQEFRAAVELHHSTRRPVESHPISPGDSPSEPVPACPSSWPHIGDVTPVPPHARPDRTRVIQQFLPPLRPGRVIDLLL